MAYRRLRANMKGKHTIMFTFENDSCNVCQSRDLGTHTAILNRPGKRFKMNCGVHGKYLNLIGLYLATAFLQCQVLRP